MKFSLFTQIDIANIQMINKIKLMSKVILDLQSEIHCLKQTICTSPEIEFTFVLNDVSKLFEFRNQYRFSETFFCQSIPWKLRFDVNIEEANNKICKYLKFNLFCFSKRSNFSISTTYVLRLLSQKQNTNDRIANFYYTFKERKGFFFNFIYF